MRKWFAGLAAAAMLAPVAAQAQDMRLDAFLETAERLERRGALALLSRDLGRLKREVEASAELYRERVDADREAGRDPHSCPPERGGVSLSSDEVLAHFRTYPEARRPSITVRSAFFDMMARRFPCG